jgi:serine/threonine-protein kinase RsbW
MPSNVRTQRVQRLAAGTRARGGERTGLPGAATTGPERGGHALMRRRRERFEFDVDRLSTRLDVTFPGRLEDIAPAVERVMAVVRETRCATGSEFEIEVALDEALANAVKHGCRLDDSKMVEVAVMCDPAHGLLVVVRDPGDGFDPARVPSPLRGERLFASHGRGIFMIDRLMDEVRYERGGAEIWMRKAPRHARTSTARRGGPEET